jgi:hypothetical protein
MPCQGPSADEPTQAVVPLESLDTPECGKRLEPIPDQADIITEARYGNQRSARPARDVSGCLTYIGATVEGRT